MCLKQSTATVCTSSYVLRTPFGTASTTSSPRLQAPKPSRTPYAPRPSERHPRNSSDLFRRGYASVGHHNGRHAGDRRASRESPALPWPPGKEPTPYDIFHIQKGAVYNKTRFYELAKLYHPDRKHHTKHDGVPHLTKLERYRLVVAANDILSDPVKRRLYDLYGAGWGGKGDMQSKYREVDRAWRSRPGNASMNATWEDWERWYQERDGVKQQPVFTSNGVFAGIVVLLVLIGGWGQTTRAGKHSVGLLEMRDQKHEGVSKELQHRISESSGKSRQDRVETFLRQREGWGYDSPSVPER